MRTQTQNIHRSECPDRAWSFYVAAILKWMRYICLSSCLFEIALFFVGKCLPDTRLHSTIFILVSIWTQVASKVHFDIMIYSFFMGSQLVIIVCFFSFFWEKEMHTIKGKQTKSVCNGNRCILSLLLVTCYCRVGAYCWIQWWGSHSVHKSTDCVCSLIVWLHAVFGFTNSACFVFYIYIYLIKVQ